LFNEQWSGYGKLSIAGIDTKVSGTGVSSAHGTYTNTYGIGGQFNFNQAVGVRFGVDLYSTGGTHGIWELKNGKLTVVSIGVAYMF